MDLVNTQLVATQQQLRHLEERYNELSMHHSMLLQELIGVQKTVVNHEQVMNHVMSFLQSVEAKHRRESRIQNPNPFGQGMDGASGNGTDGPLQTIDDLPASPLANAQRLLTEFNADVQLNYKNLEHMNEMHNRTLTITTPPPDTTRNGRAPTSAGSTGSMPYAKLNDLDNLVYPVGQNNGIDPMYSEHINNIPYPMPPKEVPTTTNTTTTTTTTTTDPRAQFAESRKKSAQIDPGWIRNPQILLVEDDPTCRRIGSKFLYAFHCHIDSAVRIETSLPLPVLLTVCSSMAWKLSTSSTRDPSMIWF
jgi:osomolarity two-component system, response regulator SKN7